MELNTKNTSTWVCSWCSAQAEDVLSTKYTPTCVFEVFSTMGTTAEGVLKKKHAHTGPVFCFQQGGTDEGRPNTKNTPMWACFLCLVGR